MRSTPFSISSNAARLAAACLVAALAACGGDDGNIDSPAAALALAQARIVAPLVHDDGSLALGDPRAVPPDPGARTAGGRYATTEQARMLGDALGDEAIQIEVEGGATGVEQAVGIVWGLQAARALPDSAPVLVRGPDLRLAALVANRLREGGLTHVWLVTP